jgi:hypothetical protein
VFNIYIFIIQIFRIRNIIINSLIFVKPTNTVSSIEYIVYSEEDKLWITSADWRIVIADGKISIE